MLIAFTENRQSPAGGRGGRQVELGVASALQLTVLIVGPSEHVFHYATGVSRVDSWKTVELLLGGLRDSPPRATTVNEAGPGDVTEYWQTVRLLLGGLRDGPPRATTVNEAGPGAVTEYR